MRAEGIPSAVRPTSDSMIISHVILLPTSLTLNRFHVNLRLDIAIDMPLSYTVGAGNKRGGHFERSFERGI